MPLPWYITFMTNALLAPTLLVYPFILTLEAFRGTLISGLSLGLFIEEEDCPVESIFRDLSSLRIFLDRMKDILDTLPPWARPLLGPYFDYYLAAECFHEIMADKAMWKSGLGGMPETCADLYEKCKK